MLPIIQLSNYPIATQLSNYLQVHYFKLQCQSEERRQLLERLEVEEEECGVEEFSFALEEEKDKLAVAYLAIVTQLWEYLQPAVEAFQKEYKLAQVTINLTAYGNEKRLRTRTDLRCTFPPPLTL